MTIKPTNHANKAADLVAQMTLEEKAGLCSGQNFWELKAVKRLGLPRVMVTDGPHGLRKQDGKGDHVGLDASVPATCFPPAVALAASWDRDLVRQVGVALGQECRTENVTTLLGPGVNIKRHPLCGRNFEYFSEDPYQSGEMAVAMIDGVQSQGVGTSIKHYAANNQEEARMVVDTIVDERTLREIYLPSFEAAITRSQPWTVMCAYNKLNGTYCSEHDWLLNQVLRDEWSFEGLVVTDWGAQNERVDGLEAGLDLEMPSSSGINDAKIVAAVKAGTLDEEVLNKTARRITQMILAGQEASADGRGADLPAHHDLARDVARQTAVLLKNEEALLPIAGTGKIAVIGAFAKTPRFQGAGSSQVNPFRLDAAFDVLSDMVGDEAELLYAPGYDPVLSEPDDAAIAEAVNIAKQADTVLLFAGLPGIYEAEGTDRQHMRLPEQHNRLIEAVCASNPKTILVLSNGAPIEMPWADQVPAILEAYLGGQAGGSAVIDLLLGKANPCGKLAETFPFRQADIASDPYFNNDRKRLVYREGLHVGYRDFDTRNVPVRFPFGHGLSYTRFDYSDLTLSSNAVTDEDKVTVSVTVTNSGAVAGAETVQLYVRDTEASVFRPEKELKQFAKIHLAPGEGKTVSMDLDRRAFAFFDAGAGDWIVESGAFDILVGASSLDIRLSARLEMTATRSAASTAVALTNPSAMTDEDFERLGQPVLPRASVRPFHINSALEDVNTTFFGKRLVDLVRKQAAKTLGEGTDPVTAGVVEAIILNMPLRNLVTMSGGAISGKGLEVILHVLNHRYGKALMTALSRKPS